MKKDQRLRCDKEVCIPGKSGGERSGETHRELDDTVRHSETSLGCTLLDENHANSKPHRIRTKKDKSVPSKTSEGPSNPRGSRAWSKLAKAGDDIRIRKTRSPRKGQHRRDATPHQRLHLLIHRLEPKQEQFVRVDLLYGLREARTSDKVDERHGEETPGPEPHAGVVDTDEVAASEDDGRDEDLEEDGDEAGDGEAVADLVCLNGHERYGGSVSR